MSDNEIIITPALLTAWGASQEGIAAFHDVYGEGVPLNGGMLVWLRLCVIPSPWALYDQFERVAGLAYNRDVDAAWNAYVATAHDTFEAKEAARIKHEADMVAAGDAFYYNLYTAFVAAYAETQP